MVKTCEHLKTNGELCNAIALSDRKYCHFHDRFHDINNIPGSPDYEIPALEYHLTIQLYIMQIATARECRTINSDTAASMLALARTAMSNLRLSRAK